MPVIYCEPCNFMTFSRRGERESANDEMTLVLIVLSGEERGAQAGAVL